MPNTNIATTKKGFEKKRYLWVINVLKIFVGAMTLKKQILDLGLTFTIGKLLTSALVVKNSSQNQFLKMKLFSSMSTFWAWLRFPKLLSHIFGTLWDTQKQKSA